jgi:hypothetical protein
MDPSSFERMAAAVASGKIRTAGVIQFQKDQGPLRRDIRAQGFEWRPDTLRNLAKILWAAERSHSYGIAALRMFSKMPSSEFSPDGLLGGRGYIQQVKDMRTAISQAVEVLSSFTDTIHDEINAPHWAAVEDKPTDDLVDQVEATKQNPEQFVEQQFQNTVHGTPGSEEMPLSNPVEEEMNPSPDAFNPFFQKEEDDDEDGDWPSLTRESSRYDSAVKGILLKFGERKASSRLADSSVPPETLPGPRVMHVGPGAGPEEFGYWTDQNEVPSDDPMGEGFRALEDMEESPVNDGATGYSEPTDGDASVFKTSASAVAASTCAYSWLPGSRNEKLMPYYNLGLTEEDVDWMRQNDDPVPPDGQKTKPTKPSRDPLWPVSNL